MTTDVPQFRDLLRPETPYGPHLRTQVATPSTDGQNFEEFLKRTEPVVRPTPGVDPSSERDLPQRADRRDQPRRDDRADSRQDRRSDDRRDDNSDSRRADDRRSDQANRSDSRRRSARSDDGRAKNERSETDDAVTSDTDDKVADDIASDEVEASEDELTGDVGGDETTAENEPVEVDANASLAGDVLNLVATSDAVDDGGEGGDAETATLESDALLTELAQPGLDDAEVAEDQEAVDEAAYEEAAANVAVVVPGLANDEELTLDDEIAIDVDADGAASTDETQNQAGDEAELDLGTEAGDDSADDSSGQQAEGGVDEQVDLAQTADESIDTSAAQDAAELLAQAATRTGRAESSGAQATSSSNNTNNPVVRVDGVQTTSANRTATVTAPAQAADAGTVDGDADDPLWMQVRRAMNSLRTLENGDQQINLRLRPAELGSIMVRVAAGENQTVVSLIADSNVAANQLSQQRQLLVEELERGGMLGVSVDVGTGGGAEQRSADSSAEGEGSSGNGDGTLANLGSTNGLGRSIDELIAATGTRRGGASSGSLIDLDL